MRSAALVLLVFAIIAVLSSHHSVEAASPSECSTLPTCWSINGTGCGWCFDAEPNGAGMIGTAKGPTNGTCFEWTYDYSLCPDHIQCSSLPFCRDILGTDCGFCLSTQRGAAGTIRGPFVGKCDDWIWSSTKCPLTADPQQIHLALSEEPTVMVVTWSSLKPTTPRVTYTNSRSGQEYTVTATTTHFNYTNSAGLQYIHKANMTELSSGATFTYYVSNDNMKSDVFTFSMPPKGTDWNMTLLVYGDMGRYGGSPSLSSIYKEVVANQVTAVIHNGDMAYNMESNNGMNGDDFMQRIQPIAARVPYMTSVGNHEAVGGTYAHYRNRFSMPNSFTNSMIMWYSVDIGLVHIIIFSSEVYYMSDTSYINIQKNWLKNDLNNANNNRHNVPWIIAFGHRPLYCSNSDEGFCPKSQSPIRIALEDLFYEQGVDVIVGSHEHSYERTWPVYNVSVTQYNYINPKAPVHIITGAAGCNWLDETHCVDPIPIPLGNYSAFHLYGKAAYGYGHFRPFNHTHLLWDEVTVENGAVSDAITIVQFHHGPFNLRQNFVAIT